MDVIKLIRQQPGPSPHRIREFHPPKVDDSCRTLKGLLRHVDQCEFEQTMTSRQSDEELYRHVQRL